MDAFRARPHRGAAPDKSKKQDQQLNQLLDREWSELPYAMMRLTAARRPWDNKRLYWRDSIVQLGEVDLNLTECRPEHDAATYVATYELRGRRRDFALLPSLEGDQLRWSASGIFDAATLTTDQLAEKLLARLVTFYTTGIPKDLATSKASRDPSSLSSARSPHSCPPPR
jgi:hypothetical protein